METDTDSNQVKEKMRNVEITAIWRLLKDI